MESRDRAQRSLGWIGFSAIVHVALVVVILFSQMSRRAVSVHPHKKPLPSALTLRSVREAKSLNRDVVLTEAPAKIEVAADAPKEVAAPAVQPVIVTRKPKVKKTRVAHQAKTRPALAAAAPAKEKLLEPYQPESIPSAAQSDASQLPEKLSPVISDGIETLPQAEAVVPAADNTIQEQAVSETANDALVGPATEAATAAAAGAGPQVASEQQTGGIVDASLRQPLSGNPLPSYPQADRYAGTQGTAVITGHVGSDGHVSDVKVEKSSGSRTIDQASMSAFQSWKFAPGPEATVRKSFAFYLQGEAKVAKARLGSGS